MNISRTSIACKNGAKKLGIILLFACSAMGAYATLGDGNKKTDKPRTAILSGRTTAKPGSFSLKSGYSYRGSYVINAETDRRTIRLNTVVTVQKGRTTFTVPLKKNVVLNKVKLDLGNRQFQRN
jgi:hypothetical protein